MRRSAIAIGAMLVTALIAASGASAAISSFFTPVGSMGTPREGAAAAPLPDGRVLVAGGSNGAALSSAEVFHPTTNNFTAVGSMSILRTGAAAAPLPDGRVLVAGGFDGTTTVASAEVFNPATNSFSAAGIGAMGTPRFGAVAALLPGGRVLIAGGNNAAGVPLATAEVFDPVTNTFSSAGIGSLAHARNTAVAAPLRDGRVLVTGGYDGTVFLSGAEVFDPATNNFSSVGVGSMATARGAATAAPLADGRVLVAGGDSGSFLSTAEVFDPATSAFSSIGVGSMGTVRSGAAAAPLTDGRVLVAGGYNGASDVASAEVFEPAPEPASAGANFGDQTVGQGSVEQSVEISNLGVQVLRISGASLGGTNPGDYAVTGNACSGAVLAFGQTCAVRVRFTPSTSGPRPALLTLTDNASTSPQAFALDGRGVPPNSGPQGPAGPQGPPGRDATVTCKVKKKKVKCSVSFTAGRTSRSASARLSRGGRTFARGSARVDRGRVRFPLISREAIPPGQYLLTLKVTDANGRRAVTRRTVSVA